MLAFFDPPTWAFNVALFWLAIGGTLLGTLLGAWAQDLRNGLAMLRNSLDEQLYAMVGRASHFKGE